MKQSTLDLRNPAAPVKCKRVGTHVFSVSESFDDNHRFLQRLVETL